MEQDGLNGSTLSIVSRNFTPPLLLVLSTFQLKVLACGTLLLVITRTEFISALVITNECLQYLRALTTSVSQAVSEIKTLTSSLKQVRENVHSYYSRWLETVSEMCNEVGTTPSLPRICGRQHHKQAYQHLIPLNTLEELSQFQFWTIFFLSLISGLVHIKKLCFKVYTWYHQCW